MLRKIEIFWLSLLFLPKEIGIICVRTSSKLKWIWSVTIRPQNLMFWRIFGSLTVTIFDFNLRVLLRNLLRFSKENEHLKKHRRKSPWTVCVFTIIQQNNTIFLYNWYNCAVTSIKSVWTTQRQVGLKASHQNLWARMST